MNEWKEEENPDCNDAPHTGNGVYHRSALMASFSSFSQSATREQMCQATIENFHN
jgi:hypothetical protein